MNDDGDKENFDPSNVGVGENDKDYVKAVDDKTYGNAVVARPRVVGTWTNPKATYWTESRQLELSCPFERDMNLYWMNLYCSKDPYFISDLLHRCEETLKRAVTYKRVERQVHRTLREDFVKHEYAVYQIILRYKVHSKLSKLWLLYSKHAIQYTSNSRDLIYLRSVEDKVSTAVDEG